MKAARPMRGGSSEDDTKDKSDRKSVEQNESPVLPRSDEAAPKKNGEPSAKGPILCPKHTVEYIALIEELESAQAELRKQRRRYTLAIVKYFACLHLMGILVMVIIFYGFLRYVISSS